MAASAIGGRLALSRWRRILKWGLSLLLREAIHEVWFTADTHFGHGNIIKYCNRPFLTDAEREEVRRDPRGPLRLSLETVARHDAALLDAINSRVADDDTLWILGDFCWGKLPEATAYRSRIRCGIL